MYMRRCRGIPVLALAAGLSLSAFSGQAVAQSSAPAEFPPASYSGTQYVDSQGCVFVRAGFGGQVTWVPRLTRDRESVCGATPSLGARRSPAVAAAPEPRQAAPTARQASVGTQARAGAERARRAAQAQAKANARAAEQAARDRAAAQAQAQKQARAAAQARAEAETRARPAATARTVAVRTGVPACPERTGVSRQYTHPQPGVRCGPQAQDPVTGEVRTNRTARTAAAAAVAPADTRRRVVVPAPAEVRTPPGYREAWTDGRLNPNRGPRTAVGEAQMGQVWTDDVPRQGKRRVVVRREAPRAEVRASTKAPSQSARAYVQVGAFGQPSNASGAAARLRQSGLPVATSRTSSGLQVVLAGPFSSSADASRALGIARGAGFSDAFLRR
ncbi:SPOR domain-containing protein [Roseicyclus sp. F158]|uniref:SPOR domain-containing protein n=1 Tax=Tropicimonas omnivorans TaxID=3075590 RepID=A0ABU3DEG6_9RHOB|nr:SPOR domain-containing protein [Roseicyclus sp. F158]MDT0682113.1 SPOR domain-containing protein [Roseicyclus sp. F158]